MRQNSPFGAQKSKIISEEGHDPSHTPNPLGAFGASIFAPTALDSTRAFGARPWPGLTFYFTLVTPLLVRMSSYVRGIRTPKPLNRLSQNVFSRFFKMAASAILDSLYACLGHPRSAVGAYRCAKFGWIGIVALTDVRFSILC